MSFSALNPARIGIIGAGNIARRYVAGIARFPHLALVGCADILQASAETLADEVGIVAYGSIEHLLADPTIDIVVNITPPVAHAEVTIAALEAGKHVYVEKPITATYAQTARVLAVAEEMGLLVGAAPDTFLGSAGQTARAAIDAGHIGPPLAAVAFVLSSQVETWHPDPTFLFQPGGGPALDMGPYYITTLVNVLGPVEAVTGFTRIGAPTRAVTSPGRRVDEIEVTTPTHSSASLRFVSGEIATVMLSFDVWDAHLPAIEIYGQRGTLTIPDPNEFDGDVTVRRHGEDGWTVLPPVISATGEAGSPDQLLRGLGVADLATAIDGGPHRASAALAIHVLEVLEAIQLASDTETVVRIASRAERPSIQEGRVQAHAQ